MHNIYAKLTNYLKDLYLKKYFTEHKQKELDKITENIDINLPLHIFILHDIFVNISEIASRINFTDLLDKNNIMLLVYDKNIRIISKPIFATNNNLEIMKSSVYIQVNEEYMVTENNTLLEDLIKNKKFKQDCIDLTKYKGDVFVHKLN